MLRLAAWVCSLSNMPSMWEPLQGPRTTKTTKITFEISELGTLLDLSLKDVEKILRSSEP